MIEAEKFIVDLQQAAQNNMPLLKPKIPGLITSEKWLQKKKGNKVAANKNARRLLNELRTTETSIL